MKETWKEISGYEGLYEVSNLGHVRSLNYNRTGKTQILKPGKDNGYLQVMLYKDGKPKSFYVHRPVANAFPPNPLNLPELNHINEDKSNNAVSDLEFCSAKYNINFGTGIKRRAVKSVNGPTAKQVLQYDKEGNFLKQWPSIMEVERSLGFAASGICKCRNGKKTVC